MKQVDIKYIIASCDKMESDRLSLNSTFEEVLHWIQPNNTSFTTSQTTMNGTKSDTHLYNKSASRKSERLAQSLFSIIIPSYDNFFTIVPMDSDMTDTKKWKSVQETLIKKLEPSNLGVSCVEVCSRAGFTFVFCKISWRRWVYYKRYFSSSW